MNDSMKKPESLRVHIDSWIDSITLESEEDSGAINYAKFFFMLHRLPAYMQSQFHPWTKNFHLYCDYEGKSYRCTGASRMGDIWLSSHFDREHGYDLRVDVSRCTNWRSNCAN